MSETPVKISIKGKVSYEDEITVAQAARIITFLNSSEGEGASSGLVQEVGAPGKGDSSASDGHKSGHAAETAREALDLSGAKTNPEKIVALGAFLLQDGVETFRIEDVKSQFRRARETLPANFSRDLSIAVQAGWIAQGEDDEYYITSKIQGIFEGDFKFPRSGNGTRARGASKSAKPRFEKPDVFANIDEFSVTLEGFPPYAKMKTGRDKILWALQFSKVYDIKGLTNKEIAWVTDQFGAGVPSKDITSAFNRAKAAGYANRSTQDRTIRITNDGEAYLKKVDTSES